MLKNKVKFSDWPSNGKEAHKVQVQPMLKKKYSILHTFLTDPV